MLEQIPSPGTRSPAERRLAHRAFEAPNAQLELNELEYRFLFSDVDKPWLEHGAREIADRAPGQPLGLVTALEGALQHEQAENLFRMSLIEQGKKAKKPIVEHSREEVAELRRASPHARAMEEAEDRTIERYDESLHAYWKGKYVDRNDIRLLRADLRARQITRNEEVNERAQGWAEVDHAYERTIEQMDDPGKRFEAMLTYLVRRWIREAGKDHVMEVRHALPREDMAEATDLVCTLGDQQFNVQLKALTSNKYVAEETGKILEKAVRRTSKKGALLAVMNPQDLLQTYAFTVAPESDLSQSRRIRRGKGRATIIRTLANVMGAPAFEELLNPEEDEDRDKRLTPKFFARNTSVGDFMRVGLLTEQEAKDPQQLLAVKRLAKERFSDLFLIFKTQGGWANPTEDMMKRARALRTPEQAAAE